MRRLLPSRSPPWWVIVLVSLGAVGVFMIFEVMDLDGSDLHGRNVLRTSQHRCVRNSALAPSRDYTRCEAIASWRGPGVVHDSQH